ncbi:MAG: thioredoxin family protein, partial [Candidatus Omnitrophica bacterium]|nr:thioredoxin family protein [Candidatus Omnitrophota bacterium]
MRKIVFGLFVSLALLMSVSAIRADQTDRKVVVYFFWGEGCPHCGHEKPFLDEMKTKYPGLVVKDYEVWRNIENKVLYRKMSAAYGETTGSVPATFVDFRSWIGYNEEKSKEIAEAIGQCMQFGCLDPADLMNRAPAVGGT